MNNYFSLAAFPGKNGEYFYNSFFEYYKLDACYKSLKSDSIKLSLADCIQANASGISISMPFKSEVIPLLNFCDRGVLDFNSCNTILVKLGNLYGYNTDLCGVENVVRAIDQDFEILILGNGAMGKMFARYLNSKGRKFKIVSRSMGNWSERHQPVEALINCTALGTADSQSPISEINGIKVVYDLAFKGSALQKLSSKIEYYSGLFFYKSVFLEQFNVYTGIKPDEEYFEYLCNKIPTSP